MDHATCTTTGPATPTERGAGDHVEPASPTAEVGRLVVAVRLAVDESRVELTGPHAEAELDRVMASIERQARDRPDVDAPIRSALHALRALLVGAGSPGALRFTAEIDRIDRQARDDPSR